MLRDANQLEREVGLETMEWVHEQLLTYINTRTARFKYPTTEILWLGMLATTQ